jgi:flagellar FliL protein
MAKVSDAADDEQPAPEPKKSRISKKLILIIGGVVALVGVSVGGSYLAFSMLHKDEPTKKVEKKKAPANEEQDADAKDPEAGDAGGDGDKATAEGGDAADAGDDTEAGGEGKKTSTYVDFEQPVIVNFMDDGQLRYLQIGISVLVKDPKTVEDIKHHMPMIRNNLVMLFSGQTRDAIIGRDGKEKIRKEAEAEVQKVLKEQTGKPGIKSLYFTSFVMQ